MTWRKRYMLKVPAGLATAIVVRAATGHWWMSVIATILVYEAVHIAIDMRSKRR